MKDYIKLKCSLTGVVFTVYNTGIIKDEYERIKKHQLDGGGYPYITCKANNLRKNYKVHRLVAKYFVPNPDNKPDVNHLDGVKTNTHYTNFEWCTKSENMKHAVKLGLCTNSSQKGEKHNTAKITFKQVQEIREVYKTKNISMRALAKDFKCSVGSVSDIINMKTRIDC